MKKSVLSIEQMQALTDRGINVSNASMCWVANFNDNGIANEYWLELNNGLKTPCYGRAYIPTFDLQDILELLPECIGFSKLQIEKTGSNWVVKYVYYPQQTGLNNDHICVWDKSLLTALYRALIRCIENNHIKHK